MDPVNTERPHVMICGVCRDLREIKEVRFNVTPIGRAPEVMVVRTCVVCGSTRLAEEPLGYEVP